MLSFGVDMVSIGWKSAFGFIWEKESRSLWGPQLPLQSGGRWAGGRAGGLGLGAQPRWVIGLAETPLLPLVSKDDPVPTSPLRSDSSGCGAAFVSQLPPQPPQKSREVARLEPLLVQKQINSICILTNHSEKVPHHLSLPWMVTVQ